MDIMWMVGFAAIVFGLMWYYWDEIKFLLERKFPTL